MNIFKGIVSHGKGYGRKIGYPTVNILVEQEILPKEGVYSGVVVLEGQEYRAGVIVGPGMHIEAHLIGYQGDAYGKEVQITICKFLRDFKKFETEEELKAQIKEDLEKC